MTGKPEAPWETARIEKRINREVAVLCQRLYAHKFIGRCQNCKYIKAALIRSCNLGWIMGATGKAKLEHPHG